MEDRSDEVAIGADVDVKVLMADVRAEVERKMREGLYPPEVLDDRNAIDALGTSTDVDQLGRALVGLRHGVSFDTAVPTASRLPVLSPLAASFKRAVRSSVHWYVSAVVQQVEQFGANVLHVLNLVSDRLRDIEAREEQADDRHRDLTDAVKDFEARLAAVRDESVATVQAMVEAARRDALADAVKAAKRLDALEIDLAEVRPRDRLALLERAVRSLEGRVESGATDASPPVGPDVSREVDATLDYVDFESHFRGSEEEIRERQTRYLDYFTGVSGPVVDLGCGRGEFLELLKSADIAAYGVDRHPQMVALCREKGLDARVGDVMSHLSSVTGGGPLGGIFSAQMIEHLPIAEVPRFFELAADALAPGGRLVVETINPESLVVFAEAFYVDLGHSRPLHPLSLRFLAQKAGFAEVTVEYSSQPPAERRPSEVEPTGDERIDRVVETVNENFRRLDRLLFGPQDYAIVATR